jgi:hypothetical protein
MKFIARSITTALCLVAFGATSARAVPISLEAADNATVQLAGPRAGANGKAFFNLEGSSYGNFVSFGVADFNLGAITPLPGPLLSVSLQMTQSNAGFSTTGPLSVYLTEQTSVDIQPANTSLNYVAGSDGSASVDADLAPLSLLGSGLYTVVSTGTVDTISLSFTGGALTALQSALAGGTTLRLVITPDAATTAATYAGFSNSTLAGPTLVFEALPEPGTAGLLGLASLGLLGGRRRGR